MLVGGLITQVSSLPPLLLKLFLFLLLKKEKHTHNDYLSAHLNNFLLPLIFFLLKSILIPVINHFQECVDNLVFPKSLSWVI